MIRNPNAATLALLYRELAASIEEGRESEAAGLAAKIAALTLHPNV